MPLTADGNNVFKGSLGLEPGEVGALWREFGAQVVVGHPTYGNHSTIGPLLEQGIANAWESFGGRRVAFVVSDGTWNTESGDETTARAALQAASEAVSGLPVEARRQVHVVVTPYDGYGGDRTPGKGSALKLIFDEMGYCDATLLVLLDGDLRNDMASWHRVFGELEVDHERRFSGRPMFVTARYARHFVDASLTRFIVGPLTTLMGKYVPGGISGDIALSARSVKKERDAEWTMARRAYGTDISTTFDNVADPDCVIYEAYLGAKLHDITDEAKLSVMPAQVIGAALERLLDWQQRDGRVLSLIRSDQPLGTVVSLGPDRTGIGFVDPGTTDVFNLDVKLAGLADRFDEFAPDIEAVQGLEILAELQTKARDLKRDVGTDGPVRFLGVDGPAWIEMLHRAVAYVLREHDVERPKRCLNYLYTAAFLEFVKDRLCDLGLETRDAVRRGQAELGVPADQAELFYADRVDAVARELALRFFSERNRILELMGPSATRGAKA